MGTSMYLRIKLLMLITTLFLIRVKKAGVSTPVCSCGVLGGGGVASSGGRGCAGWREVMAHSMVLMVITTGSDPKTMRAG